MSHSIDRRRFLKTTASGAAGLAVWSAAGKARAYYSANDRIVLGVMGTNGRGRALAGGFAQLPGATVAYVCDPDEKALVAGRQAAARHQDQEISGVKDYRRILEDDAVDALVIAAPDHWHAPATIAACAAGKHVYVEKPASHNGREGQMMIAAARKYDRRVQLGTQRRSSAGITEAIERIHRGDIGRTLFARGWINSTRPNIGHGKVVPAPDHLDYGLWQGPAPEQPYRDNVIHYNWHWFWNWGTGELGNNGIHALDVCRWGLEVDYPDHVVCGGGKFHFDDDQETPDTQIATFHFGQRAINWEHRTWSKRGFEGSQFGTAFYGEEGSLVITGNRYAVYDRDNKQIDEQTIDGGETAHLTNFLDAIRDGTELNAEIETGVKSTTLCNLGNIAYRTGRTVRFDPQTRQIAGDADVAALWGREYRPGWEPAV